MRAALALLLLAPFASADVRVVSPQGPYTQIQAAVNAANDGDLVLVKPGTYTGFQVQAKSLAIVGDPPAGIISVGGAVTVSDLAPGQTVSLIRLQAIGAATGSATARVGMYSNNNQGSVRCQGCAFLGGTSVDAAFPDGGDGVRIDSSSDVSIVGCSVYGGASFWESIGLPATAIGGIGARCQSSTLTIFDSTILGGVGAESFWGISGHGNTGLQATGCTIFSSNATIRGGQGGFGAPIGPVPGNGGAGAAISGSLMRSLATSLVGGQNGDYATTGQIAPSHVGGTYDFLPGAPRTLNVSQNPVRELQTMYFTFQGGPNELVYLLVGQETAVQWDPVRSANFLIAPPQYRTLFMGMTSPEGTLFVSRNFSALGATTQSEVYFLQPLFSGAGGAQQLGTPITLAALDQQF